ncbi:iron-sulfur cluster repair di-iron protein [soil metagenome]
MINIAEKTLASIVTEKHQTVPVLEKYNLDFCCKGRRTLAEACTEKGLSVETVSNELQQVSGIDEKSQLPFTEMNAEQLINYILIYHHFYVKQSMPIMFSHLQKVAAKHGGRFPYMLTVLNLFAEVMNEMTPHMQKEEQVLFPRIKQVEAFFNQHKATILPEGFISIPVSMMETEHEHAGRIMDDIRQLTNNYTAPEEACTTFKISIAELKEFEEDLHKHVHLENNLLFPLAKKMLQRIITMN